MSLYRVGMSGTPMDTVDRIEIIGAASPPAKNEGWTPILIVLGLLGFTFVVIPGKKGWQRALKGGEQ